MALDTTPDFPSGKRCPYTRTSTRYTIDAARSRMWPPGAAARRRTGIQRERLLQIL